MNKINGDDPAFPFWGPGGGYGDAVVLKNQDGSQQILDFKSGLSKREFFAAQAMQGLQAANMLQILQLEKEVPMEAVTKRAVEYADSLIEELNK